MSLAQTAQHQTAQDHTLKPQTTEANPIKTAGAKHFVLAYSCGKDSTLSLYRLLKQGHRPRGLIVKINPNPTNAWVFRVAESDIQAVADSLGIPLYLISCEDGDYGHRLEALLTELRQHQGVEACAFGDIDLRPHRDWSTERCTNAGVEAWFPLWHEDRLSLVQEFIGLGFKTLISAVQLDKLGQDKLGEQLLGQELTLERVAQIQAAGACPCGEDGEYHTLVFDGPLFEHRVEYQWQGMAANGRMALLTW